MPVGRPRFTAHTFLQFFAMKLLLVHNDYHKHSGEESVVDRMTDLFEKHGHQVIQLRMTTANSRDSFRGQMHVFFSGLHSREGVRRMRRILQQEKPDIINIHNLYPFIGPASLFECRKIGIPVVMTVHNYRLICPTGLFMRDGKPCETCLEAGNEWGCIKYNCEHSFPKSVAYAARNAVARLSGAYTQCVDRYACITHFQREKLIQAGFDEQKVTVIPNTTDAPPDYEKTNGQYVAFCGRLSEEKGIDLILKAARQHPQIEFRLAGTGNTPALLNDLPPNVHTVGFLTGDELSKFYKNSAFLVMASRWYEGFPMTILEAARYGKATIAPSHGSFPEIIGEGDNATGLLFQPNSADDLAEKISSLWHSPDQIIRLGERAFEKLHREYNSQLIYEKWSHLFEECILQKREPAIS